MAEPKKEMNHEQRKRRTRATLVWGIVFLIVLAAVLLALSDAKAEWVTIDQFGGIVTHASAAQIGFQTARKSVGWLYRSGELERAKIDQMNTETVTSVGSNYILPSYSAGHLLYYTGTSAHYSIHQDTSSLLLTSDVDTVITYQGDSTVRRYSETLLDGGFSESNWLQLVQSNISAVIINDYTFQIWGFYDDSTLILKDTAHVNANGSDVVDTTFMYFATTDIGVTANPPDAFLAGDTVWIVDGDRLTYLDSDSAYTISFPSCNADMVAIDTLWHATRDDDSLLLWGNFDFDGNTPSKYWVIFGDSAHARGTVCRIHSHLDDATTDERLLVDADSSIYAWYTEEAPFADDRHCLVGAYTPAYRNAQDIPRLRTVTGTFDYQGTWGTPTNTYGILYPDDHTWITSSRDWDCDIVVGAMCGWDYWFARIIEDTCIYLWNGREDLDSAIWDGKTVTAIFGAYDPYTVGVAPGADNEYSISCLHRRRAFYAGVADEPTKFTWSYQNHYDSIYTEGEKLEGDDPITSLASWGQQLVIFRRHGIEYVTGFSIADFYKVPAPAGVGAASNHCVAKNPLDNSLYFINERGLFTYNGGAATEVPTGCPEIFSDSINWLYEKWIWAAVYDRKYWLACPFGSSETNDRLIAFDLESGDVAFIGGFNPGCVYTWSEPQYGERLYVGDADSSVLWQMYGTTDDLYYSGDWRSGWYDGGNRNLQKRALRYRLCYDSDNGDTLILDYYTNFSETTVWSDTIIASAANEKTVYASVGRAVLGHAIAIGIQSPNESIRVIDYGVEIVSTVGRRKQ
jgi:hypothetical protein